VENSKLNFRQQAFAREYMVDLNATQAAIRAGYSKKTAYSQGQRLLKHVEIKAYIDKQLEEMQKETIASAEEVIEYLTSVLRGENEAEIVVVEGTGDGHSSARRINKQPDERERLKAAELLGKRYGLFTDNINTQGNISVKFNIPRPEDKEEADKSD
jgi:phage terminase small subunit